MIHNYSITTKYSVRADHIYGTARPLLQGGIKHHSNTAIKVPIVTLTEYISLHHKYIELYIYFYINIMPFLNTKLFSITFLAAENFSSNIVDKSIQEFHTVTNMYKTIAFNISVYHRGN